MEQPAMRPPETVMRLARLGSFHQCRLSFMRILTRRMQRENWTFSRPVFDIDAAGVGHAVYTATGPDRSYSLIAYAHDLPSDQRSDRVIATAWDATFALFDGVPTADDIARLAANIPLQEAGRVSARELSVSRANRSVRLWAHVVDRLAQGRQPDRDAIDAVGYLMRTTAVYGSGKLGAADRAVTGDRPECIAPFQIEMLSVFLTRAFVRDLVNHMARAQSPGTAVPLAPGLARRMGIGNSTGLGLAPFIVNHPVLFNNWIAARECALARVRAVAAATPAEVAIFADMTRRANVSVAGWHSQHPIQIDKLAGLRADLATLAAHLETADLAFGHPWDRLYRWAETALGTEGQELLVGLLLEPYGDLVDDLADSMAAREGDAFAIDGAMTTGALREAVETVYDWALARDWSDRAETARAWYVSAEKLEPRLGERYDEPVAAYEQPLAPGRDAAALHNALAAQPADTPLAAFLCRHPEHRHMVRRVQIVLAHPYAEIRDNIIHAGMLPIDMLRCKLAFFGAVHFDPRSDRWVRISMYQDAPFPEELAGGEADFWTYPAASEASP